MASVTQLISGSQDSGTSLSVSGLSFQPGDYIVGFINTNTQMANVTDTSGNAYSFQDQAYGPSNTWVSTCFFRTMTTTVSSANFVVQRNSTGACSFILYRIRPNPGSFIRLVNLRTANANSTSITLASSGYLKNSSILFGAVNVSDDTYVNDTDTFNGTWSSPFVVSTSSGADRATSGQYKFVTAPGEQNYGGSFLNGQTEEANIWVVNFDEIGYPHWGMSTV